MKDTIYLLLHIFRNLTVKFEKLTVDFKRIQIAQSCLIVKNKLVCLYKK